MSRVLSQSCLLLLLAVLFTFPYLVEAGPADDACYPAYVSCVDAAQKMSGLITTPGTPSNLAWRACGAQNTSCKEAFGVKNDSLKAVGVRPAQTFLGKPVPTSIAPISPAVSGISGDLISVTGEVEVSTDGGKTYKPWTKKTTLKYGDVVMTSFESTATIKFPYGQIEVWPMTQFRIDEYVTKENLQKTQLHLYLGAVTAKVKHTAAIRSDFSVTTPAATASIRGSAMKVTHHKTLGTTITALEGTTYWKKTGQKEEKLTAGASVIIAPNGKVTKKTQPVVQTPGKPSKVSLPIKSMAASSLTGSWKLVKNYVDFDGAGTFEDVPIVKRVDGDGDYVSITADNKMCFGTIKNGTMVCDSPYAPMTVKGNQILLSAFGAVVPYGYKLNNDELELVYTSTRTNKPYTKSIYKRIK